MTTADLDTQTDRHTYTASNITNITHMFFTAYSPNLKTPVITFVNAHTTSHYLQTSVLS